jgi:putative endonuclease
VRRGILRHHLNLVMAGLDPVISTAIAIAPIARQFCAMLGGWIYLMTNRRDGTLYLGVTGDLPKRVWQHREGVVDGFTRRYRLKRLVYAEHHADIRTAIQREKNIKHWPRAWKVQLIESQNPDWMDLCDSLL